jgi:hypothetical protein
MSHHSLPAAAELDKWSPNEDRRAEARRPTTLWATYRDAAEESVRSWRARLLDVSPLGAGLLLPQSFPPGAMLLLELLNRDWGLTRQVLARVIHVQEAGARGWVVGCAFAAELDDLSLRLLHAERIRPTAPDARRWVRFPCNVETVCYTSETAPGERRPARILNVSSGGVGLLLPCEFAEGTLLHFELPTGKDSPRRKVLVRVVRALEHGSTGWVLGCEFADRLDEAELERLLS